MATLVNKLNREVKVIIPNMREFRTFYSDNEGVIGMFFKRDWEEETTKKEGHWKPSEEQVSILGKVFAGCELNTSERDSMVDLFYHIKDMI